GARRGTLAFAPRRSSELDGPKAAAKAAVTGSVLLDESDGTGFGVDGIHSATITAATIAGLFETPAYGADGSGGTTYKLSATDGDLEGLQLSNPFRLAPDM